MKQLIIFCIVLVAVEDLTANIIHNNGGRSRHIQDIDRDETKNRPVIQRNQIPSPPSNEFRNRNVQDSHGTRRIQHHRDRTPERTNNVEHGTYSNNGPESYDARRNQYDHGRPTETDRLPDTSQYESDVSTAQDTARINQPHTSRRPGTGKRIGNTNDQIYFNITDDTTRTSPPDHSRRPGTEKNADNTIDQIYFNTTHVHTTVKAPITNKNTTLEDRFITNPGDNCGPGEVKDLVTNQCRPEIKDD